jgi:glycosyltransferase involved in cell wall biosynthesis
MGSVLLEAASCRVPVIATAVGGIPEIVHDGDTGQLVLPSDPAGVARAIAQLLEHPDRARQLASAAHNALPRFGLEETARQLAALYAIAN